MKGIDIFCASQAATTTMDSDIHLQPSSSAATSGRAIDRHNPIIHDQKRQPKSSHLPKPPHSSTISDNKNNNNKNKSKKPETVTGGGEIENDGRQVIATNKTVKKQGGVLLGWGCTKPSEFISPATSTRFLLADKSLSEQFDPLLKQLPPPLPPLPLPPTVKTVESVNGGKSLKKKDDDEICLSSSPIRTTPLSSSFLSSRAADHQAHVVVLRVSLHCKGCVKKMRKHLSKMEGVTSFNIDFMAKKVTVVGDMTPLAVLTSISKVKNAKLLTPTTILSQPVPQNDPNFSEIKKQIGLVV